jgi:hypothetical protein
MRWFLLPLVLLIPAAFVIGRETSSTTPTTPSTHVYTMRQGDVVRVPEAATLCVASGEAGVPNLRCSRRPEGRYGVVFYKDVVQVWREGNPDNPAFAARWEP